MKHQALFSSMDKSKKNCRLQQLLFDDLRVEKSCVLFTLVSFRNSLFSVQESSMLILRQQVRTKRRLLFI